MTPRIGKRHCKIVIVTRGLVNVTADQQATLRFSLEKGEGLRNKTTNVSEATYPGALRDDLVSFVEGEVAVRQ